MSRIKYFRTPEAPYFYGIRRGGDPSITSVPNSEYEDNNLNLYNFESIQAQNSPHILTSPRSLKACRLAGIKPTELLYRGLAEIAYDLNLSVESVQHIYKDLEHDRLKKLEKCRTIRKQLIHRDHEQHEFPLNSFTPTNEDRNNLSRASYYSKGTTTSSANSREFRGSSSNSVTPVPTRNASRQKSKRVRCSLSSSRSSSLSSLAVGHSDNCTTKLKPKINVCQNVSNKKSSDVKNRPRFQKRTKRNTKSANTMSSVAVKKDSNHSSHNKKINNAKKIDHTKSKNNKNEKQTFLKNCEKILVENQATDTESKTGLKKIDKPEQMKYNSEKRNKDESPRITKEKDNLDGLKNQDVKILDTMAIKRDLQRSQDNLARKARFLWNSTNPDNIPYIIHSSDKTDSIEKIKKNSVSFDAYYGQIRNRVNRLKENSLTKEMHSQHVRQLARELQAGMEQWQDQVLVLQWQSIQRAQTNAKLHIENKRLRTQCENNERMLLHALRMKNVRNMEHVKEQMRKEEVTAKDERIEKLRMKKEREIQECRSQALYTAELRDQLRRTLTPETFDQKVNKANIDSKFIKRSLTASPLIQSHIQLG